MKFTWKQAATLLISFLCALQSFSQRAQRPFFPADHELIQYVGRIDFTNPGKPKFWAPGVYIKARFTGSSCEVFINDEVRGGNHNYIQIIVDDNPPVRIKLRGKTNRIVAAQDLADGEHTIVIVKDTEGSIGYLEFAGLRCESLVPLPPPPNRKLEFFGNSITCGTGADTSAVACGAGKWHDQHNAYQSFGATTARMLNSQWHLSAVSGIGMVRSCCNMGILMPDVYDKVNLREDSIPWDFHRYQPHGAVVCLGQNDGIQDSAKFCSAYVDFLKTLRSHYPETYLFCLASPMADEKLAAVIRRYLTGIVEHLKAAGEEKIAAFFFDKRFNSGCDDHPSLQEHQQIAGLLAPFIAERLSWQ